MRIMLLILATLVFVEVFINCVHGQEDCNPYTNCEGSSLGSKVPDPKDCHNYYICIEELDGKVVPSDNSYECGIGYYFNYNYETCLSGTCTNSCLNICQLECIDYQYERVAEPNDCSIFYTCRPGGIKFKDRCPVDAPYFDGATCSTNSFSCCDGCLAYCEKAYTEVGDPFNCRNYYLCSTTGEPSESNKYSCPDEQYFDPTVGKCTYDDPDDPCTPRCFSEVSTTVPINKK